jgi:hypothetical protein
MVPKPGRRLSGEEGGDIHNVELTAKLISTACRGEPETGDNLVRIAGPPLRVIRMQIACGTPARVTSIGGLVERKYVTGCQAVFACRVEFYEMH